MTEGRTDLIEARERLAMLRGLIARYRRYLEEGANQATSAAYLQAIHAAEAEILQIERGLAEPPPSESTPPESQ
jgi:hypothetical protein